MRRPILAALLFAGALVLSAPLGAAVARMDVTDADVFNTEGQALTRVALGQAVRLQARVNNTGDTAFNGTLEVVFTITNEAGTYNFTRTITTNQTVAAGDSTNVTLSWVANQNGKHTLEAYILGDRSTTFTLHYTVAQTEVVRESLGQMLVDYIWVYAAFVVALVLFFAVVRRRRTR